MPESSNLDQGQSHSEQDNTTICEALDESQTLSVENQSEETSNVHADRSTGDATDDVLSNEQEGSGMLSDALNERVISSTTMSVGDGSSQFETEDSSAIEAFKNPFANFGSGAFASSTPATAEAEVQEVENFEEEGLEWDQGDDQGAPVAESIPAIREPTDAEKEETEGNVQQFIAMGHDRMANRDYEEAVRYYGYASELMSVLCDAL
jgi:hypothetical protein